MTTFVFAAYITGLLPTLIFFGGISDRIGRKAALFAGLSAALCATVLMIYRPGPHPLFISRILQGVGVGLSLSMGAGSAYLAESIGGGKAAQRSAGYVAIATSLGFGGGALFTGTVLLFSPSPSPISYWIIAFCTAVCLAMTLGLRGNPAAGGSLLRLPYFPKGTLPITLAITLAWAVTGVVISLMPAQLARNGLSAWAGHALFLVNGTGVAVQPWARKMDPRKALSIGAIVLPIGYFGMLRLHLSRRVGRAVPTRRGAAGPGGVRLFRIRLSGFRVAERSPGLPCRSVRSDADLDRVRLAAVFLMRVASRLVKVSGA